MVTGTNHPYGGYSQGNPEEMYGSYNEGIQDNYRADELYMHYPDPAIINPEELATFPKQVKDGTSYHHHHHESHLVNKRTPVRDGRNITRTDNHPEKNGFM